jgi:hypothetical protein
MKYNCMELSADIMWKAALLTGYLWPLRISIIPLSTNTVRLIISKIKKSIIYIRIYRKKSLPFKRAALH